MVILVPRGAKDRLVLDNPRLEYTVSFRRPSAGKAMGSAALRIRKQRETWEESTARALSSDRALEESLLQVLNEDTVPLSRLRSFVEARKREKDLNSAGA